MAADHCLQHQQEVVPQLTGTAGVHVMFTRSLFGLTTAADTAVNKSM